MSLLNVLLRDQKAVVAVDTANVVIATGAIYEGCKMIPLANAGCVLAGRGSPLLLYNFVTWLHCSARSLSFDFIAAEAPTAIDTWFEQWVALIRGHMPEEHLPTTQNHQLVVVGWSEKVGRMAGLSLTRDRGSDTAFRAEPIDGVYASPAYEEDLSELTVPNEVAYMQAVAEAQVRAYRGGTLDAGFVIGGRLMVAELTRDAVTIRSACRLQEV